MIFEILEQVTSLIFYSHFCHHDVGKTIVDEPSFGMKGPTFGKPSFPKVASLKNVENLCFKG